MRRGGATRRGRGGVRTVLLVAIVLAAIALAAWFAFDYVRFSRAPLTVTAPNQTIEIARGETFRDIVRDLRAARLTRASPLYWRALAEQLRVAGKLHAGEYALPPGITPQRLLIAMGAGRVLQHHVTLVDGWTFRQVRAAMAAAAKLSHASAALSDAAIMQRIGAHGVDPEGQFMPDTYDYVLGMSDIDVLKRAHVAMQKYIAAAWNGRDPSVPLQTAYEALILASIVEKETAQGAERPQIAGVFERRLKIGMKLETDPTVIYGMGASYTGNIHKQDLQTDTPYNTYTRAGLPPTPIALPGRAAIDAVLHPADGNALYFVARGDGTHVFSATLAEHNHNVAIYQLHRAPAVDAPKPRARPPAAPPRRKQNTRGHGHRHR